MESHGQRKYDLVIFGASGFTGQYVVEEVVRLLGSKKANPFTWAVSGRSKDKLSATLKAVSTTAGEDLSHVDSIIADIGSLESLKQMARQCRIVVNCVGPYILYGENVVKACISEGTSTVDISGEPQFLEGTQVKYHQDAEKAGVYVIGSCGFDCVPADCGTTYLQQKFDGDLETVQMFFYSDTKPKQKPKIHYGTYHSLIQMLINISELEKLKEQLFPKPLPSPKYSSKQGLIHYNNDLKSWFVPFIGYDSDVVRRSQYYMYHHDKQRPAIMHAYAHSYNFILSVLALIGYFMLVALTKFGLGVSLLENYPRLCTLGVVSHAGPTKEEGEAVTFSMVLIGEGYSEKLTDPSDRHEGKPDKKMKLVVSGRNPGYSCTGMVLIQSALTILNESDKMPSKGGVYPPGCAFAKTTIVERLNSNGLTFVFEPIS